jgi:hypothetical protein
VTVRLCFLAFLAETAITWMLAPTSAAVVVYEVPLS